MIKKATIWLLGLVLLLGTGLNAYAMEENTSGMGNSDEAIVETVDFSDWVYQAGGFGVPESDKIDALCAIQSVDEFKAELEMALRGEVTQLNVQRYNIYESDMDSVRSMLAEIINANPELFYAKSYLGYSLFTSGPDTGKVIWLYLYYDDVTDTQKQLFAQKINKVKSLVTSSMTDEEKAMVLHDYLVQNCSYAYEEFQNGTLSTCGKDVFGAYGALVEGEAVCQGYALAYNAMLSAVGIESELVSSSAMNHAWNIVEIDGAWYHVDSTWDDPVWNTEGQSGHYYFLVSDAEMLNRGHSGWGTSVCTSTKYDAEDYWWTNIDSQIVLHNGKMYYLQDPGTGFELVEKNGSTITSKYSNDAVWEVWGEAGWFWSNPYSYLSRQGDYIYFNDKVNLYSMSLNDFSSKVIYTYTGGDGYIYGAMVYEDGYARLNISQTPDKNNDDYITVSLKAAAPTVTPDYTKGTLSTTAAMEYSMDGVNWTRCTDNMKINSFSWGDKDKLSIWFRTAAANGLLASDAVLVEPKAFKDVVVGSYYEDPVQWAVYNGITTGWTETTFNPEGICSRGQVVTFLWRANGSPEPASTESPFIDVQDPNAYYYKAVLWAVENGITTGWSNTTFWPDGPCSRGQVVTFMWRAQGEPASSGSNPFVDLDTTAYYYAPVLWAVENGITTGLTPTTFGPNETCSRGQIVTFLYRGMN